MSAQSNVPSRVLAEAAEADATLAELAAAAAPPPSPALQLVEPPPNLEQPPSQVPPTPAPTAQPVDLGAELMRAQQFIATQNGRLQAQAEQMRDITRQLDELRQGTRQPQAPQPGPPQYVTPQDREDYGDDLINLVGRIIKQSVEGPINNMALRVAALESRLGSTVRVVETAQQHAAQTIDERYFSALDARVPSWEATNTTTAFVDWLKNRDKLSGETYYDLLAAAHQQRDADRVVEIFRAYKPELVHGSPDTPAPPASASQQPGRIDPSELAAPVTTAPAAPPTTPPQGAIWTQADVNKLYDDKNKGRISQADFDKLERQYHQALVEGRVSAE